MDSECHQDWYIDLLRLLLMLPTCQRLLVKQKRYPGWPWSHAITASASKSLRTTAWSLPYLLLPAARQSCTLERTGTIQGMQWAAGHDGAAALSPPPLPQSSASPLKRTNELYFVGTSRSKALLKVFNRRIIDERSCHRFFTCHSGWTRLWSHTDRQIDRQKE